VASPGEHWVTNSLAVMAAVRAVGGDLGAAGLALAEMEGLKGRGARIEIKAGEGTALLIDESYNANPASMRATLAQLGACPAKRRIAVLGAMKELGEHGPAYHAGLIEPLIASGADFAILVGAEMAALAEELGKAAPAMLGKPIPFAHCLKAQDALQALCRHGVESGDAILVKGSNSVGLGAVVAALASKEG
jgi:UDP-N-acetylmuramoyl-tripeptide--D-alanyl-D-alanine ligase